MTITIRRKSGEKLLELELDSLRGADLRGADLGGAHLRWADLCWEDLREANLRGADLRGANLRGADLRGADLRGTDLRGTDLREANLGEQWIVQGPTRSDGYFFFLQKLSGDSEPMVKAGCRYFTLTQAHEHWETTRAGQSLLLETRAIIHCMVELAHARGLM